MVGRQGVERERVCFLYSARIRALLVAGFSQRNNSRMFRPATAEHGELRALQVGSQQVGSPLVRMKLQSPGFGQVSVARAARLAPAQSLELDLVSFQ